ncbi:MAG: hypothetical protein R6X34_25655 [Chloroflexota bacterium]
MGESAAKLIQSIDNQHLALFAQRLGNWLMAKSVSETEETAVFTESRAKALFKVTNTADDATLHDFARLLEQETAVRIALYTILKDGDLADNNEVAALAAVSSQSEIEPQKSEINWLSLIMAAYAWKNGYPLHQLDPATPPEAYSPAGQTVKRTAHFLRQQIQRSPTERDKFMRKLAYNPADATGGSATLDTLQSAQTQPPLPPYYRPPIPVNYPEVARDTVSINENDAGREQTPPPARSSAITITEDDINPEPLSGGVTRMPTIRITSDQIAPSAPGTQVITPNSGAAAQTNFTTAVRQTFGRKEPLASTKLRILVQEYPDGPGLYGLQVRVTCQGVKSHVAGTTNREGKFLCELPVRVNSGLTYDVDVTWPREMNNEIERKSITLNADRTEFTLPFYRKLSAEG